MFRRPLDLIGKFRKARTPLPADVSVISVGDDTPSDAIRSTSTEFFLLLDAGDHLPSSFIEKALLRMRDHAVGFVQSDGNAVLIRRQLFDLIGGEYGGIADFSQKAAAFGYVAGDETKQPDMNVKTGELTIFTPFAGRADVFGRYLEGLQSTDVDPSKIHLWWYNTATDPAFEALLKTKITLLPFASVRTTHAPIPLSWQYDTPTMLKIHRSGKDDAEYEYQLAVLRAYNTLINECDTEYVLTVEDDHVLQPETVRRLMESLTPDAVSAIAPYMNQRKDRYEVWMPRADGSIYNLEKKGEGIADVGGCGFGCSLFRTSALKRIAPLCTGIRWHKKKWYDQITYERLKEHGRILCNWDLEVAHLPSNTAQLPNVYANEGTAVGIS